MKFQFAAALLASAAIATAAPAQNMSMPELPVAQEQPAPQTAAPAVAAVQPAAPARAEAQLPSNSEIVLAINADLSTKTHKVGDKFSLTVAQDVSVDGQVVIPKGTRAVGQVTMRTGNGGFGKSGKMEMAFRYLELQGKRIPLEGNHRQEGEGNTAATVGAVVAAGVVGGLLVKGKSARVPEGREFTVRTIEPLPVSIAGAGGPATILASYVPAEVSMQVESSKERKAREKREKAAAKKAR